MFGGKTEKELSGHSHSELKEIWSEGCLKMEYSHYDLAIRQLFK